MPKIPMAIRIDPDVKAKIERQAAAERRSLANLIEMVMNDYCDSKSTPPARSRQRQSED